MPLIVLNRLFFWIEANLDKTDFNNIEEAQTAWEERKKANTAQLSANILYYECMADISVNCGYENLKDFFKEMRIVYGVYFM